MTNERKKSKELYEKYMSLYYSLERFKKYFGEVSYCYLNEKKYNEWDKIPTAQDMVRLSITYEKLQKHLTTIFNEYTKEGKK